tara:strand:+ start:239 stop:1243 length:1005 start_codon:yes stop_codon:yes gene_type:complete
MNALLNQLVADDKKINKDYYSDAFWTNKNKKIVREITNKSIKNFRGMHTSIGTNFADGLIYDYRNELNTKGQIVSLFYNMPLVKKIFEGQLKVTSDYIKQSLKYQSIMFQNNSRVKELLKNYSFINTTEFGCIQKFSYEGKEYSCRYLEMANRIDNIKKLIDFSKIKTYFEIGGGFGANIHFLLTNFKNVKKVVFLDRVPNLYVGTEYLRSFFGNSVIDYTKTKEMKEIKFKDDESLEIYCIAPWQIEKLNIEIDHFHNACSFVEMPPKVIQNYAKHIYKNKVKSISIVDYEKFDPNATLDPKKFNNYFNNDLKFHSYPWVIPAIRKMIYSIKA